MTLEDTAASIRLNDYVDDCLEEGFPTDPDFLELFRHLCEQQKPELERYGSEPIVYYSRRDGSKMYHSHITTVRQLFQEGVLEFVDDTSLALIFTEEFEAMLNAGGTGGPK